jgi:hypothetical protein
MCFEGSQIQISNRNKYGFCAHSTCREKRTIGAQLIRDFLAFGRQVAAPGDK